ncbi:hypothetical protein T4A_9264 [Trichinella pseudospiralis]|uniref:Secreted protein n=1 Tax=Trichinella pseudospiralis TaxID=6337 RepID=A0A0V1E4S5_TRIPS|nr:hypothetical protein T4A_9264 [Trichinella pseudospiralis]KRZ39936.1 hypothetical protein T4C_11550 [Trichinella pseudospiralis]
MQDRPEMPPKYYWLSKSLYFFLLLSVITESDSALSGVSVHYVPGFFGVGREEFCSTLLIITVNSEVSLSSPAVVYNAAFIKSSFFRTLSFLFELLKCCDFFHDVHSTQIIFTVLNRISAVMMFENDQRSSLALQPDWLRCQINSTKPCLFNCLKLTCLRRRHVAAVARRLIESSLENTCSKISNGRSVSFNAEASVDGIQEWVFICTPMASVQVK